ncbi:MAG: rod shape-determining protein MreC [Legionellales bacterium RIFCSPHIGHO2_12_FULL_35_11]|nr:MAG: rod shape-determining protein MreC [Legionellales bacterium RIFCSPHIGHO2_12_FULL_35_11]
MFFQQNNRLFVSKKSSSLRFALAIILAFALMVADSHERSLGNLRGVFSVFVAPLQYAVDYPLRVVSWVGSLLSSKNTLIAENMQLRYKQTMLEAKLQKLVALQAENSELKNLLLTVSPDKAKSMVAQILAVDTSSNRHLLVLNKGSRDGVIPGQAVLDAKGVMGQIIDVGLMTSTVLLISDIKGAVPVRNDRTGERAILVGNNSMSKLSLINLPKTSSVVKGDLLVTSGLGRRFPEGYPVGVVNAVFSDTDDDFIKVEVKPVASLNNSRLVLLIWPEMGHNDLTMQISERLKVLEGFA